MSHQADTEEFIATAETIAAKNGGRLPPMSRLMDMGYSGMVRAIRIDRSPFEHLLPKLGRGRDKNKYAYVEAHMDEDDEKLARDLDVSKTTVKNWKTEIAESQFQHPDPSDIPDDATIADLSKFVIKNIPDGWNLDMKYDGSGCFITLVKPNGMRCGVDDANGANVIHSVVAHVNFARVKSGLPPVGWSS